MNRTSEALKRELKRLQQSTGLGHELSVIWLPDHKHSSKEGKPLKGQVKNNLISIYLSELSEALETLKHEFIEYLFSQAIQPYVDTINLLNSRLELEAYLKRETIVKALTNLLNR